MPRAKAAVVGAADSTGRCETGSKRSMASETAAEADSSPAKRKPKARGKSPSPRSTTAKAKIKWSCLLDHGDSVPGVLQCDDDGGGDDDDGGHTAEDAALRSSSHAAAAVEEAASNSAHVEDLVSLSDTFFSAATHSALRSEEALAAELELGGTLPTELAAPRSGPSKIADAMDEEAEDEGGSNSNAAAAPPHALPSSKGLLPEAGTQVKKL